jgi:hypothetical protein
VISHLTLSLPLLNRLAAGRAEKPSGLTASKQNKSDQDTPANDLDEVIGKKL